MRAEKRKDAKKETGQTTTSLPSVPSTPQAHPLLTWLRGSGFVSILLGAFGVMYVFFWPSVFLIHLGIVIWAIDLWFEPWFLEHKQYRKVGILIFVLILGLFNWKVVFRAEPLIMRANIMTTEYPTGTLLGGITWEQDWRDLRVSIENPSYDQDYIDIDLTLRPDWPGTYIMNIGQIGNVPNVVFSPSEMQAYMGPDGTPIVKFDSTTGQQKEMVVFLRQVQINQFH